MKFSISRLRPSVPDSYVRFKLFALLLILGFCVGPVRAQVNSGSDGHDGAFNPTQSVIIDMTDHPDGIYQYTSVNIPSGVTVTFKPNATNTPLVWLVQGDCAINGAVAVNGAAGGNVAGAAGGPGGYGGGNGALGAGLLPGAGLGPGGGTVGTDPNDYGGNASFATVGDQSTTIQPPQFSPGPVYGNIYLVPLVGGSGGSGRDNGGGGGGAIIIASSTAITITAGVTHCEGGFSVE